MVKRCKQCDKEIEGINRVQKFCNYVCRDKYYHNHNKKKHSKIALKSYYESKKSKYKLKWKCEICGTEIEIEPIVKKFIQPECPNKIHH